MPVFQPEYKCQRESGVFGILFFEKSPPHTQKKTLNENGDEKFIQHSEKEWAKLLTTSVWTSKKRLDNLMNTRMSFESLRIIVEDKRK